MRREILFSLLGFLGGFVVAAIVFWQAAVPTDGAPKPVAAEASSARDFVPASTEERSRHRLVVSARENDGVTTLPESASQPKGAAETFHEVIGKLKDMDPKRRQAAIDSLVKQLRAMGPEGLQMLRDYFRAGQDVKFSEGYTVVNGKAEMTQTLRTALLNALGDWPGDEAVELTRDVLRSTSRMVEASVAVTQLEKSAPGAYRAEAIQAFLRIAERPADKNDAIASGNALMNAMRQFKAPELLVAAESFLGKNAWHVPQFAAALDALPADVRGPALQRMFANEAVSKNLASNAWGLQSLNYAEPIVTQNVAQIFASNTDKRFRENILQSFASDYATQAGRWNADGSGMSSSDGSAAARAERIAQLHARAAFLETIAPQCNTPVLQERLQDARDALQKAIANPDYSPLVKQGAGTLIFTGANSFGGDTTVISSGTIEIGRPRRKNDR